MIQLAKTFSKAWWLTTGADTLTGGSGADVFTGSIDGGVTAQNTLGAADKIVGGAGIDTLNVTVSTGISATNGADISGVEILNVRNIQLPAAAAVEVVASTVPGLTAVVSDRSTGALTVTDLAAGAALGLKGNGTTVNGTVTGTYLAAATAATLTLDSGVVAATPVVTINGTGLTSATITSTGAANSLATNGIAFGAGSAVRAVTVDAQTNVSTGNITGLAAASTVTVKGAGTANIGTLVNVTTLDASANLGGVTANLGAATTLVATGGAGNDVFTTGAVLATGANVNAGAGTADRLVISDSLHLTAAAGALYKGFEQLQVANGVTADVSLLAANNTIGTVVIADGAGATGVSGLSAAQAANVQITSAGAGAITIGLTGASTAGQGDTVKAALTTSTTAGVAQAIDLTGLVLAGVEKLELTANGTTAANSGAVTLTTTGASALDSIILKSAGLNTITVTTAGANLSVDASGSTGNTTINAGGYVSTTGASLKGGAGHDVLTGSAQSDNIVAGAGNDVLATSGVATVIAGSATATAAATITNIAATLTASADVLTGGAGNDSFVIAHSEVANVSSITDLNLGTNVVAGAVDSLWFNGATAGIATLATLTAAQQTTVTNAGTLAAAVDAVLANIATANTVAQFTYGADTYLVANGIGGVAAYDSATDSLIKITGVTGVLDGSDVHFAVAVI